MFNFKVAFILIFFQLLSHVLYSQYDYEPVHFNTEGGEVHGAYFEAGSNAAIVFFHGAVFNQQSWYFLADAFQKRGVNALSIDFGGYGKSKSGKGGKAQDVLSAIAYLRETKQMQHIYLVGGSMGGSAVLKALDQEIHAVVKKVVLMAPAGGQPILNDQIDKLFIVSRRDGLYKSVQRLYEASTSPKVIEIISRSTHAQHLFKTNEAQNVQDLIIDFILK